MTFHDALPIGIFALVYLVLTRGNLLPLRLDRAGAALVGAVAMVVSGAVSPAEAEAAISFPTLMLLQKTNRAISSETVGRHTREWLVRWLKREITRGA